MSLLQPISCQDQDSGEQFARSMHEIGFAVLKDHGIDLKLLHQAYQIWEDFFKSDEKFDYPFNQENNAGYFSKEKSETAKGNAVKDIKEFFHFYPKLNYCPEHLAVPTGKLVDELLVLAHRCLAWAQEFAPAKVQQGFSMPLVDMIKRGEFNMFRPIHYPPVTGVEPVGAVRAASHTDINLLTLLFPSSAKGLQVKHKNGQWLDVPTDKDWLVINVGDMLDECSGSYYPSTLHRVINPEGEAAKESRISMPFFLHADGDVVLSERYTADSYRMERFIENGSYKVGDKAPDMQAKKEKKEA